MMARGSLARSVASAITSVSRRSRATKRSVATRPPRSVTSQNASVAARLVRAKAAAQPKKGKVRRRIRKTKGTMRRSSVVSSVHSFSTEPQALVPTILPLGRATPYPALARETFTVNSTDETLIFLSSIPGYGTIGVRISYGNVVGGTAVASLLCPPLLAFADDAGGPTSSKPMALWGTLVNNTQSLGLGGQVYSVPLDQRMLFAATPSAMTGLQWGAVASSILSHPNTRSYSGADFVVPHGWHNHVVDHNAYDQFTEHHGALSGGAGLDTFFAGLAVWPGSGALPRAMSTTVFYIPNFRPTIGTGPTPCTWTLSVYGKWYLRYPVSTIPGQSMKDVRTATSEQVQRLHLAIRDTATHPSATHHAALEGGGPA